MKEAVELKGKGEERWKKRINSYEMWWKGREKEREGGRKMKEMKKSGRRKTKDKYNRSWYEK